MITFFALFLTLFVFTMTAAGIIEALGVASEPPQYSIQLAAELIQKTYLKASGVPEAVATPLSYFLIALPAVITFYLIRAMFQRR